jgi:arylsulfatase
VCSSDLHFLHTIDAIGTEQSNVALGPGWAQVGSTPLYREKGYMSEGGIRVPMIVKLPNGSESFKNNAFSHVIDITPTVLDYAGVEHPGVSYDGRNVHSVEGKSLKPLFEGKSDKIYGEEPFVVELFGNKAVYKGDWKALQLVPPFVESTEWKLFNISEDIRELDDLSSEYPELLEELKQDYDNYAKHVGVIETKGLDIPR